MLRPRKPGLALAVVFACLAFCVTEAGPVARSLTRAEGASLAKRGLEYSLHGRRTDCSHLIHQVLSTSGLTYRYATSSDIFAGIQQFRRVRFPDAQPGDLIVWPGHIGLVVDPQRSTFYSSTTYGVRVEEYHSDYWRRRGAPRFYRYLVTNETTNAAALMRAACLP